MTAALELPTEAELEARIREAFNSDAIEYARLLRGYCHSFELYWDALVRRRRGAACVEARRRTFVELRRRGWSLPRIGEASGYHHTTVLHHLEKATD